MRHQTTAFENKGAKRLNPLFGLDGRVALVTGAGSGIGQATAVQLAVMGAAKVILVGRSAEKLQTTVTMMQIAAPKCQAEIIPCDLYDAGERLQLISKVVATGKLDILVNNAGTVSESPLRQTTPDSWAKTMELNLTAPFDLIRGLVDLLAKSKKGSVINVSSTLAVKPVLHTSAYNASKAALGQMTRTLALELGPEGIRVNAVLPSIVDTPLYRGRYADDAAFLRRSEAIHKLHPIGRMGQSIDVANAIVFLAGDAAAWITGVELPVDGGMLVT